MNKQLEKAFARLETLRETIQQEIGGLEDAAFKKPESPGKWSLSQVMTHLMEAENASLKYVRKKMQGIATLSNAGPGAAIRLRLLYLSQVLPLKFKAPAVVSQPPGDKTALEIFAEWQACRDDLRLFLDSFPEEAKDRLVYRHPVAGRFTFLQCLKFLQYHILHHQRQVRRILVKVKG